MPELRITPAPAPSTAAALPWALLAWALALLAVLLLRLGAAPLVDVDEGAFAEATRELLASGDWGHTTLNGADRFDKPIAIYWLQAASVASFGLGEAALRLPSALAGWAWALALLAFARPRLGRDAALNAAVLLVASFGVLVIARAATADATLNLLLTLAALDLWRHAEAGASAPLRRAFVWMGLGLLVKGPIALLLPLAALLLWAVASRQWAPLRSAVGDGRAWALLLLVAAPWYAYALQRHGWAFVDGFLLRHNLQRFGSALEGHGGGFAYYLLALPLLLLPCTPLLLAVLRHWREHWAHPLTRYLICWSGFVLLFFSLSGTKLPHYGLYGASPLLLLAGIELARAGRGMRLALVLAQGLLMALLLVPAWWTAEIADGLHDPFYRALFAQAPAPDASMQLAALAAGGLTAAGLPWALRLGRPATGRIGALFGAALIAAVVLPWWIALAQTSVRQLGRLAQAHQVPLVQWRLHQPSVAVYRGQPVPRREPRPGEWALTRSDRLNAAEPWPLHVRAQSGPYLLVERPDSAP